MVNVTETITENDDKEYKFEYTVFDAATGAQLAEKRVETIQEEMLIEEKTMLENRRDEDIARYNDEIAEIDVKLAAIDEAKT
jgi:hypothetical protein